MKYTTNYNLNKPDYTDGADIPGHYNENMDKIDTELKAISSQMADLDTKVETHKAESVHIGNNPACMAYKNTTQSIESGVEAKIALNATSFDNDNIFDSVNSRLVCKTAGIYLINANISMSIITNGNISLRIKVNNTIVFTANPLPQATGYPKLSGTVIRKLNVNDYIELFATQDSGSAKTVDASNNYYPNLTMVKVG